MITRSYEISFGAYSPVAYKEVFCFGFIALFSPVQYWFIMIVNWIGFLISCSFVPSVPQTALEQRKCTLNRLKAQGGGWPPLLKINDALSLIVI